MLPPVPTPAALARLHALCFGTPRPWSEAEFSSLLRDGSVFLTGGGRDAGGADNSGFALGRVIADEAELLTLAVHPDHRRKGRGRALLSTYENEAVRRGATRSFLEVSSANHAAITLYAQAGYRQTGQRPGYYRTPDGGRIAALTFSRSLA